MFFFYQRNILIKFITKMVFCSHPYRYFWVEMSSFGRSEMTAAVGMVAIGAFPPIPDVIDEPLGDSGDGAAVNVDVLIGG